MKPTFALDLTRDTIALLHRNPKGWLSIGEVAFDAPDLDEALDYLRKTALGLSPMGMASKIVLPNDQILYLEVTAPGPSRNDKRRQIAAALEGRTPYPVEDLAFDWSGKGATVKVAVVARETLAEAEAFATAHRLNPVSFVAIPPEGVFVGEAWFGPTAAAETLLAPGEVVDRDREAVTILHRSLPVVTTEPVPDPIPVAAVVDPDSEDAPLPGLDEALNADHPANSADLDTRDAGAEPMPQPVAADPVSAPAEAAGDPGSIPEPAETDPAEIALAEALSDRPFAPSPPPPAPAAVIAEVDEAPFAHVTDATAFPDSDDEVPKAAPPETKGMRADDIPPAPSAAAIAAFASRRSTGAPNLATVAGSRVGAASVDGGVEARLGQPIPRPTLPKDVSAAVTAPTIPGTRTKPKGRVTSVGTSSGPTTVKSPARPGGTFGTAAPPRNRMGVVFLVLVGLLLLFLAVIAAWSTLWMSQNGSATDEVDQSAVVPVPGVDDEMVADMQDPEGMMGPLPEAQDLPAQDVAALATEDAPINLALEDPDPATGAEAAGAAAGEDAAAVATVEETPAPVAPVAEETADAPAPVAPVVEETADAPASVAPVAEDTATVAPAPEPAPGTAITTDLTAAVAPVEDQDEIFLSGMDAPPPALDALALPAPATVADTAPEPPMPPPAFGTVYQFDEAGLLKPTPEGILSPEGVFLIAGKPPLVPPERSAAATAAAVAAAVAAAAVVPTAPGTTEAPGAGAPVAGASLVTTVEPAPADPAMAGFRPRPRPDGLAPAPDDGAALATEKPVAVAGLRPLARPDSVLVAASAAQPADLGAQGASLAAQAEADLAAAAALEAQDPSIVAISKRPEARPRDLSRAVEAAVAAAVRAPDPEPEPEVVAAAAAAPAPDLKPEELAEADEPDTAKAAPKIPTKTNVAKQATFKNAINLSKISLIGTYGTDSKRYALIRQASGRYKKVKVGDQIDGGTVKAITATEVRYQKGGKLLTLAMPKA